MKMNRVLSIGAKLFAKFKAEKVEIHRGLKKTNEIMYDENDVVLLPAAFYFADLRPDARELQSHSATGEGHSIL